MTAYFVIIFGFGKPLYYITWYSQLFFFSEFQDAEPIVEEPESPAVDAEAPAEETPAAEVSEDEQAEPDVTDEE